MQTIQERLYNTLKDIIYAEDYAPFKFINKNNVVSLFFLNDKNGVSLVQYLNEEGNTITNYNYNSYTGDAFKNDYLANKTMLEIIDSILECKIEGVTFIDKMTSKALDLMGKLDEYSILEIEISDAYQAIDYNNIISIEDDNYDENMNSLENDNEMIRLREQFLEERGHYGSDNDCLQYEEYKQSNKICPQCNNTKMGFHEWRVSRVCDKCFADNIPF